MAPDIFFGFWFSQPNQLIALQPLASINRDVTFSIKLKILSGSNDKAPSGGIQIIKSLKIQITTIHDIDASGDNWNHVQGIHIMGEPVGNMDKCRYITLQIY